MSQYMMGTQIPYLRACNALRWEVGTGCSNTPDVCAVKATEAGCWAEKLAREKVCKGPCRTTACPNHEEHELYCTGYRNAFAPTFHRDALPALKRLRRPRNIAVGFGGDFTCLPVEDRMRMWEAMVEDERHLYITLTKAPERLTRQEEDLIIEHLVGRLWFGVSLTGDAERTESIAHMMAEKHLYLSGLDYWASVEPILEPPTDYSYRHDYSFVVLGALTDGKGRVVPVEEGGSKPEDIEAWVEWLDLGDYPELAICLKRGVPKRGHVNTIPQEWLVRAKDVSEGR